MLNDGNSSRHFDIDSLPASINKTVGYLAKRIGDKRPNILVILGSGLGSVLSTQTKLSNDQKPIKNLLSIPYSEIPGVPISTVSGHAGVLEILDYNGKIIAIMRGPLDTYEYYTSGEVVRIMRALALHGLKTAVISNAAGSTSTKFGPGDIVLIRDHINMTGITLL
jgi:purine nucleoside phosphorylase